MGVSAIRTRLLGNTGVTVKIRAMFHISTLWEKKYFGDYAMQKSNFRFQHGIVANLSYPLKKFEVGSPTGNFEEKNILCENCVEIRWNDGTIPSGKNHIQGISIHFLWHISVGSSLSLGTHDTETTRYSLELNLWSITSIIQSNLQLSPV